MAMKLGQHDNEAGPASLSDAQFAELKELLRPGYELSKLMLADYMERATAPPDDSPAKLHGLAEPRDEED